MKISIDLYFLYVKLVLINRKEIFMKDSCCMKMISFIEQKVLVIIDIVVLRVMGGLIIMGTC